MESIKIEYTNLIKLMYAFKNVRNMEKFLEENVHLPDGTQPILTRETMAYVSSLSIRCVCLHANTNLLKGRALAAYERVTSRSDLECTSEAATAAATAAPTTTHRGMVTRTRPPTRPPRRRPPRRASRQRRPRRGEKRSEPFVGRLFPRHNCHGGAWNKPILITNTRVRIE
jgi:hypothetical protein